MAGWLMTSRGHLELHCAIIKHPLHNSSINKVYVEMGERALESSCIVCHPYDHASQTILVYPSTLGCSTCCSRARKDSRVLSVLVSPVRISKILSSTRF